MNEQKGKVGILIEIDSVELMHEFTMLSYIDIITLNGIKIYNNKSLPDKKSRKKLAKNF